MTRSAEHLLASNQFCWRRPIAARHWTSPIHGVWPIGGDAHCDADYQMFRETLNPYRPSIIEWPELSDSALNRLTVLPIWDIAVQTEGKARPRMMAYARSLADHRA